MTSSSDSRNGKNADESNLGGGTGSTAAGRPARRGQPVTAGLSSPFTQQAPSSFGQPEPLVATRVEAVQRAEKPWGHEEIFGVLEGRYVGKVLHIRAGSALSLQKHLVKDETISVRSGSVTVECGDDPRRLETLTLAPGQQVLIRAGVIHRITALVDSDVLEVSTAWPGWRTDIVRLEDRYGRSGTTQP
jgi:mannose-6-phosphate isomerase